MSTKQAVEAAATHAQTLEAKKREVVEAQTSLAEAEEAARRYRAGAEVQARERGDNLAKIAMGRDNKALKEAQDRDAGARAAAEAEQGSRDATARGLREALAARQSELETLKGQTPEIIRAALWEQAEGVAAAYRRHAEELEPLAAKLTALNRLAGVLAKGNLGERHRWEFLEESRWIGVGAFTLPATPRLKAFHGRRPALGPTAAVAHRVRAECSILDDEDLRQGLAAATAAVIAELEKAGVPVGSLL